MWLMAKAACKSRFIALISFILFAMGGNAVHASDESWGREFFPPVVGDANTGRQPVQSMAIAPDGSLIYAGVNLDSDGGVASLVRLSASQRIRLGFTFGRRIIYALAIAGTNIYVGGDFSGISQTADFSNIVAATNLAKWDGSKWSAVGGGVNGIVRALAVKDGELFVGGNFTTAGTTGVSAIARWDGTNWSDLGGGVHPANANFPAVRALQFIGDRLYVGGNFDSAGGVAAPNIAEFNNGQWKALTMGAHNGVTGTFPPVEVRALAANTNAELIVGGTFNTAGGVAANMVAKWTGSEWSALGGGLTRPSVGSVEALYCQGNEIYAGGSFISADGIPLPTNQRGFARWDGTKWTPVFSVLSGEPTLAITGDGTNIFAATRLNSPVAMASSIPVGIIKINGTNWSILGGGIGLNGPNFAGVQAITTNATTIQVNGAPLSGDVRNVIEWDGGKWIADGPGLGGTIEELAYLDGITYAVGSLSGIVGGPALHGVAAWNGTNWFNPGDLPSFGLTIAVDGTNVYAGHQTGIQRRTESGWVDVGNNLPGEVRAIAFDGPTIYAGGNFSTNSPEAITNIATFTGDQWKPLGGGVNGTVRALAVVDHKLYAGGDFTQADGRPANNIAVWDGAAWKELGGGISNGIYATTVYAMQPDGVGGLFVGGDFRSVGDQPANFIAHWTGANWETLGSGLNGPVTGLAIKGEDMFVIGSFTRAGNHPSLQIARWRLSDLTLSPVAIAPNGTISLEAHGLIAKTFVLQQSADLRSWQNVSTNALTPPSLQLQANPSDAIATFYRLVVAN
jgi:trimeric autotransporter adhesin